MGVDYYIAKRIRALSPIGKTLTIGRQNWWCTKKESQKLGLIWHPDYSRTTYAEPFFCECGASNVDSVDIVSDENPTFVCDLTKPLPTDFGQYDTIIDLGTAEHIADQAPYWKNLHSALHHGGRLVVCVPANQHCGHGLYQFSPEFFATMGGFMATVWMIEYGWTVKAKPYTPYGRFEVRNTKPTYVYAVLTKNGPFSLPIQNATTTHCRIFPFAEYLLDLPFVRNVQRLLA